MLVVNVLLCQKRELKCLCFLIIVCHVYEQQQQDRKKAWTLNALKNEGIAWPPASAAIWILQGQGRVLHCVLDHGERALPSVMRWRCPVPASSTSTLVCKTTEKVKYSNSSAAPTGVERASRAPALLCLAVVQSFPNCLFCSNLSWHLNHACPHGIQLLYSVGKYTLWLDLPPVKNSIVTRALTASMHLNNPDGKGSRRCHSLLELCQTNEVCMYE